MRFPPNEDGIQSTRWRAGCKVQKGDSETCA
jgi:hypothetical protein